MRLSQQWIDRLVQQPETGMNYQICNITLKGGEKRYNIVIANSAIVVDRNIDFDVNDIQDIEALTLEQALAQQNPNPE